MFGDNSLTSDLIEELLGLFTFEDLLELNDLSEEDVLRVLLEGGYIGEPERILQAYEDYETASED